MTEGEAWADAAQRLEVLVGALQAERALPAAERGTGADDDQLDGSVRLLERALRRLEEGDGSRAAAVTAELARSVGDGWAHASPLAVEVLACAQELRRRVEAP